MNRMCITAVQSRDGTISKYHSAIAPRYEKRQIKTFQKLLYNYHTTEQLAVPKSAVGVF